MKKASIRLTERRIEMNPLVFGHFVEFMRDCIDGGMWAQLLKNRGFDLRKYIPDGVVDGNPEVADGWIRTGSRNTFEITLDSKESLAAEGYSQHINCYNAYDGYVGIAQEQLFLEEKEYEGYIWIKAREATELVLLVRTDEGEEIYRKRLEAGTQWKKYDFRFYSEIQTKDAVFEIRLPGEGEVWLDSASLMPADHIGGIWKEVFEHIKALNPPVIRYPGGCFADSYHFEDGIGAIDTRPYRANRHWGGYTDNSFGTDEFLAFCENVGCEPMICINFGSGTPKEAADWVEYCNGDANTPYGKLRAQNGHPEPYNVKYWDIGNEIFGEWEIGHSSAGDYAKRYLEFHRAMKEKDHSIICMVCGGDGDDRSQDWNEKVRSTAGESVDALCLHMYALKSMEGRSWDNRRVYDSVTGSVKKYEEILNESYKMINKEVQMNEKRKKREIKLAVTEYNLGTIVDSYREQTLEGALFNAGMLNMFIRNNEKLLMCNYSDLVNGWPGGCIVSKNGKAFGTGSYYVLKLYSEAGLREIIDVETDSPVYSTDVKVGNIEPLLEVPLIDCAAGIDQDGRKVIFAVNRSFDEEIWLDTGMDDACARVTEIYSEKTSDMNVYNDMKILPAVREERFRDGRILLKPHSVNRIQFM